jgi:hypothetical protein
MKGNSAYDIKSQHDGIMVGKDGLFSVDVPHNSRR